jgi:hypothetical protein
LRGGTGRGEQEKQELPHGTMISARGASG